MNQQRGRQALVLVAGFAVIVLLTTAGVHGQKPGPADVAAKLSGTWKLNRELSPSVGAPARGRAGAPGRGGPAFMVSGATAFVPQRGGGGGGGLPPISTSADLPPDVLAAQAAMRELQQIAEVITVKATPDTIAFVDPRGERTYAIDNKTAKLDANGATLEVKTRWDKLAVRQEFSSPQTRLVRSWEMDDAGHLVLKVKVESLTLNTKEVKAVYDRQ
jgi:hypothetical protein